MNTKLKKIDAEDPDCPCQLDLKNKNNEAKKIKPKMVFDYKKAKETDSQINKQSNKKKKSNKKKY